MSHHAKRLLLFVPLGLLLALAACASGGSSTTVPAAPTVCPTPVPAESPVCPTPAPASASTSETPTAAGVAVQQQDAAGSDLRLFELTVKPWVYPTFDLFLAAVQPSTPGQVVLALQESETMTGTYVLYYGSGLPVVDAKTWYEYAWYAAEDGGEGPQIALGPELQISDTVSFLVDTAHTTLGASYTRLNAAGWTRSQVRRMLVRTGAGEYQLAILECPPGETCDGSSASTDPFCGWCSRCSRRWCRGCRRFC